VPPVQVKGLDSRSGGLGNRRDDYGFKVQRRTATRGRRSGRRRRRRNLSVLIL
jgi:hypothetical protein